MEEWREQLQKSVNTLPKLREFINLTAKEEKALTTCNTKWGTTPYFASLMNPNNPKCPIRRQVIPSLEEQKNHKCQISDYLIWIENRSKDNNRPDTIARQYEDRIAFTVTNLCANYCRHCFRKEVVLEKKNRLNWDIDEGLAWIRDHKEIRDVLVTGGDPFVLSDQRIEYIIGKLREMTHIEMIRFGTRTPIVLPQRIDKGLKRILRGFHRVPIWVNVQCNHPKEITQKAARAVYDLLSCGVNVGNQAVLLKGINDDVKTFRTLHQKLLSVRIRPYYLFHCEPAPGIDHFRTSIERGDELIQKGLRGHTTGLAEPMYVVSTNAGKIPLISSSCIIEKNDKEYILKNCYDAKVSLSRPSESL